MAAGVHQCRATSHAVSNQHKAIELQRIHRSRDIGCHTGNGVVAILRNVGTAVSPEVEGNGPAGLSQMTELL
jgi:hypothetical protein